MIMDFEPHPYQVLGIEPLAAPGEVLKAFALAMQRKQYSPAVLANARKTLMDPAQRTLAHYFWGSWFLGRAGESSVTEAPALADGRDILQDLIDQLQLAIDNLHDHANLPQFTAAQIAGAQEQMNEMLRQDFLNS
jgi:hypothetical protein